MDWDKGDIMDKKWTAENEMVLASSVICRSSRDRPYLVVELLVWIITNDLLTNNIRKALKIFSCLKRSPVQSSIPLLRAVQKCTHILHSVKELKAQL
jgi:hypothetical protein